MTLDEKKIEQEKQALDFQIENAKSILYKLIGMREALEQLDKLKPEEKKDEDEK